MRWGDLEEAVRKLDRDMTTLHNMVVDQRAEFMAHMEKYKVRLEGLEAKAAKLEKADVPRKTESLRDIIRTSDFYDTKEEAAGSYYYGLPIGKMTREEMLYVIGRQAQTMKKNGVLLW